MGINKILAEISSLATGIYNLLIRTDFKQNKTISPEVCLCVGLKEKTKNRRTKNSEPVNSEIRT